MIRLMMAGGRAVSLSSVLLALDGERTKTMPRRAEMMEVKPTVSVRRLQDRLRATLSQMGVAEGSKAALKHEVAFLQGAAEALSENVPPAVLMCALAGRSILGLESKDEPAPAKDEVVHLVVDTVQGFSHRLVVNGEAGAEAGYADVAENGVYRAGIPDYWGADAPRVWKVVPVEYAVDDSQTGAAAPAKTN